MNTITANNSAGTIDLPWQFKDGCSHKSDGETLKMRLRNGMGLSDDQFVKTVLEILHNKKESLSNKTFAVQNLVRVKSPEAEESLIRIITEKNTRLGYAALKTLTFTGTEKTFEALSKIEKLPYKSLEKQKDFAQLFIGYKYGLPGTDRIMNRLLADTPSAEERQEFPLKLSLLEPHNIDALLKKAASVLYGITLSRKTAFEIKVATQTFFFCFTHQFEDQSSWHRALQTKQVLGLLLKQEQHTIYIANQYVALVTPVKDHAQISIFRKNGELVMLASIVYDQEKNSFTVTNANGEDATSTEKKDFTIDRKAIVRMHLSYLRRNKKRKTEVIK